MIKKFLRLLGPRGAVAGIITNGSEIFLTKRSKRIIIEGGKWCLLGGHIKFGEKAEETIKREIKEEAGFDVEKVKFLFYFDEILPKINLHTLVFVFLVKIKKDQKPKINWEVSEYKWFNKKEINQLSLAFKHKEILKKFFSKDF